MDQTDLNPDRYQWRVLANTVMNFRAASVQLHGLFYTVTGKLDISLHWSFGFRQI
jgi:hypothetical protein